MSKQETRKRPEDARQEAPQDRLVEFADDLALYVEGGHVDATKEEIAADPDLWKDFLSFMMK